MHTGTAHLHTRTAHVHSPAVHVHSPAAHVRSPAVHVRSPAVHVRSPAVHLDSLAAQADSAGARRRRTRRRSHSPLIRLRHLLPRSRGGEGYSIDASRETHVRASFSPAFWGRRCRQADEGDAPRSANVHLRHGRSTKCSGVAVIEARSLRSSLRRPRWRTAA